MTEEGLEHSGLVLTSICKELDAVTAEEIKADTMAFRASPNYAKEFEVSEWIQRLFIYGQHCEREVNDLLVDLEQAGDMSEEALAKKIRRPSQVTELIQKLKRLDRSMRDEASDKPNSKYGFAVGFFLQRLARTKTHELIYKGVVLPGDRSVCVIVGPATEAMYRMATLCDALQTEAKTLLETNEQNDEFLRRLKIIESQMGILVELKHLEMAFTYPILFEKTASFIDEDRNVGWIVVASTVQLQ